MKHILLPGPDNYSEIRDSLVEKYGLPLPAVNQDAAIDISKHRAAFIRFAEITKGILNGQTSIRVDGAWASQSEVLKGMGEFMTPDHVLRENNLQQGLQYLAALTGRKCPDLPVTPDPSPVPLHRLYNSTVEAAVRSAYQRDYMMFGFGPWREEKN